MSCANVTLLSSPLSVKPWNLAWLQLWQMKPSAEKEMCFSQPGESQTSNNLFRLVDFHTHWSSWSVENVQIVQACVKLFVWLNCVSYCIHYHYWMFILLYSLSLLDCASYCIPLSLLDCASYCIPLSLLDCASYCIHHHYWIVHPTIFTVLTGCSSYCIH